MREGSSASAMEGGEELAMPTARAAMSVGALAHRRPRRIWVSRAATRFRKPLRRLHVVGCFGVGKSDADAFLAASDSGRDTPPVPDAALYFPYLELPDSPALTRVLLYWDRVGVIAPEVGLPPHTYELVQADLADVIHPMDVLWDVPTLQSGFEELLERALPALQGAALRGLPRVVRLHQDKGTYQLWQLLKTRGLVRRGHGGWLEADPAVAALYMAYLAAVLARHPDVQRELLTDQPGYLEPFLARPAGLGQAGTIDRMRAVMLRDVLPSPLEPVPLADLVDFKERNWHLLGAFRHYVEGELLRCAQERDQELRARMLVHAAEGVVDRVAELEAKMRESRWRPARGTLVAALSAAPAAVGLATGGGAGDAVGVAVPFLAEVVQTVGSEPTDSSHPLAYAALARHAFA